MALWTYQPLHAQYWPACPGERGQICPRSPGQAGQYWACRGWYVHHAINYFIGGSVASHIHDDFGTQFTGLSGECACVTRSLSIDFLELQSGGMYMFAGAWPETRCGTTVRGWIHYDKYFLHRISKADVVMNGQSGGAEWRRSVYGAVRRRLDPAGRIAPDLLTYAAAFGSNRVCVEAQLPSFMRTSC